MNVTMSARGGGAGSNRYNISCLDLRPPVMLYRNVPTRTAPQKYVVRWLGQAVRRHQTTEPFVP